MHVQGELGRTMHTAMNSCFLAKLGLEQSSRSTCVPDTDSEGYHMAGFQVVLPAYRQDMTRLVNAPFLFHQGEFWIYLDCYT